MTYRTDQSYAVEEDVYDEDDEEPQRGLLSWILIVALLVGTGSGSAIAWRAYGGGTVFSPTAGTASVAAAEKPPTQGDLTAVQQQITGSVQTTHQLLAAQQAEIKRLSEQVSALASKLELLQRPVTSAQAAIPVPAPKAVVAPAPAAKKKPDAPKPVAAKPAEAKPAESRPVEAKPAGGPISTGGAPLQLNR